MIQTGTFQAGTLEVIDHDGQCLIWSNDNYGCTGYSAAFGHLDGVDCSELSEVVKGNRHELNVLNIDVNHTGLVTFTNKNGNEAPVGKTNSPSYSSTSKPPTSTPSTSAPSITITVASLITTTTAIVCVTE
ncbi:hypothetical protein N7537_007930 [Penicillium hordei]|uniref:Uncharacterized protein n=1 Tax=Penicillium hordei TaxID=40994 RepID=A0AAD6GZV2_9EURO|nr:uncharacterized protein N7537_007930 [Penicillium hordei]KAJ5597846.1 hypothetical protein N7537_007930 [Penicillium hordei]